MNQYTRKKKHKDKNFNCNEWIYEYIRTDSYEDKNFTYNEWINILEQINMWKAYQRRCCLSA